MFASIFAAITGNVILGWISRRVLEVGGWLAAVIPLFMAMPPENQAVIIAILSGQGGALSISAVIGFAIYLWSQIMSWRSTVRPQVVTSSKKRITVPVLTDEEALAMNNRATGQNQTHIPTR